jgi:aryl-alcohol dehydrogenase-like predicted oxidoreductase
MQKRKLGYTDLHLTTVGFGAWAVGGSWDWGWGSQDDDESIAAIHKALELGINWIDTAAAYGLGHSEEVIARALQGLPKKVFIATKGGLVWEDPSTGKVSNRLKAWSIRQEVENSLRRLKVDVIDLYQIHWPRPDADIEEGWTEIARLVGEGKIRYAGMSNFSLDQIKRVQKIHPVASLQPEYSLLERGVEKELLSYCAANQIGVIAYSPMASGLLTGKYTPKTIAAIHADDWRHRYATHFKEPELTINLRFIEKLALISRRFERSLGELAVAWILRRSEMTAAIVGARRPSQIAEIAPASDWQLTSEVIAEIDTLLAEREAMIKDLSSKG